MSAGLLVERLPVWGPGGGGSIDVMIGVGDPTVSLFWIRPRSKHRVSNGHGRTDTNHGM